MEIKQSKQFITLTKLYDFELQHIFECGQCFRFYSDKPDCYTIVAFGKALRIIKIGEGIFRFYTTLEEFEQLWFDYFDFSRDYAALKQELARQDPVMEQAAKFGHGIRILKQDLWETIVSFIVSSSNNVPRIQKILEALCKTYGDKFSYMGNVYYSFPSPKRLAALTLPELACIRAGYRDKYILDAAKKIENGTVSLEELKHAPSDQAQKLLLQINGIGPKVANCILLFGLGRTDAFPVDVWIKRTMEYFYFDGKQQGIPAISEFAQEHFGSLGGFAQQYLFFLARTKNLRTKG